jgi:hypothetical protein
MLRREPEKLTPKAFATKLVKGAFVFEIACLGFAYLFYRKTNRSPGMYY